MAIMRYNPSWEMDTLSKEMDKMMQYFYSENEKKEMPKRDFSPRVDVLEDKESIDFEFELPGVDKKDVKISINDENILTVKGEKKFPEGDVKTCCRNERSYGRFFRSFQLPELIDAEKVEAKFENGVLKLNIGKMQPVEPEEKQIEVK